MPWPGQTSSSSGIRFAVGKPSSRPRWSPETTSPRSWKGAPRKCSAWSTSPAATRPRMWLDETTSPSTSSRGKLLAETELFDEGAVALEVAALQVVQEAAATSDEHQQSAT